MKHVYLLVFCALLLLSGCATQQKPAAQHALPGKSNCVRTTAYTFTEAGGRHNACGGYLSCGTVHSAAADWSRYPVGTRFKIVETGETCQIDDYGSALIGTNTIDLYKDSRSGMNRWGVRMVHIEVLQWGSARQSLEILVPRCRNRQVRPMVAALRQQTQGAPAKFHRLQS